jgi:ribose transport system substrate-binding protein
MPRIVAWVASVFFLLMVLSQGSGCRKAAEPPPSAAPARPFEKPTIAVSLASVHGPWREQMKADIQAAMAKHPKLYGVIVDAQGDAGRQQGHVEGFIKSRAKAIIVLPVNPQALTGLLAEAYAAGIPVVVLDRAPIGDKYSCFVAPDWKQIGTEAAKWLAGRLHGKGKIVEIKGPADSLPAQQLHEAFRAALRDPGYRFVFEACVDPPKADGAKLIREALGQAKQFDAVFAWDDAAAHAAYEAAKAAGREKGVIWIGIGGLPSEGQAWVSQGILSASLLLPTGGAEAVDAAVKLMHGEKVPKTIVPETKVLTK